MSKHSDKTASTFVDSLSSVIFILRQKVAKTGNGLFFVCFVFLFFLLLLFVFLLLVVVFFFGVSVLLVFSLNI